MKITTAAVVILVIKPVVPELPKSVWLAPEPNAAPISDPLPVCRSTTKIKAIETRKCIIAMTVSIFLYPCVAAAAFIIPRKLSDFKEAPPTSAPSMSSIPIRSPMLSFVTLPP